MLAIRLYFEVGYIYGLLNNVTLLCPLNTILLKYALVCSVTFKSNSLSLDYSH